MLLAHARRAAVVSTRMAGTIRGTSICRTYSKDTGGNVSNQPVIELGGLTHKIISPKNPLLVPTKYLGDELPQNLLKHMRWMLQKDKLGQDMFLIGAPGSQRRRLVMAFCEMTQREVEYVSLSRDTTESDLKQRREIKAATAYYVDQAAVRAAKEGRVLVLDGIEKAERNVLPVLNNLLENREMRLESGGFLINPVRYDTLLETNTAEELAESQLIRVSENFRVIALGLPVPTYAGNPLDPPLRSRFQSRNISELPYGELVAQMEANGLKTEVADGIVSLASTVREVSAATKIPNFPFDSLPTVGKILAEFPALPHILAVDSALPMAVLDKSQRNMFTDLMRRFVTVKKESGDETNPYVLGDVVKTSEGSATAHFTGPQSEKISVQVPFGGASSTSLKDHAFHATPYHNELMSTLMQRHSQGDLCVLGGRGVGKSALIEELARRLHYRVDVLFMYNDMTARDLLQHRATNSIGDTVWRPSPVITAAREGHMLVLDGIHHVNTGTLTVLQRLIEDRELSLYDGSRLIGHDRYQHLMRTNNLNESGMEKAGLYAIHESFRIIGLAEPPSMAGDGNATSVSKNWLNDEVMAMFQWVPMRDLTTAEEMAVIKATHAHIDEAKVQKLVDFSHSIREATDHTALAISSSLTLRQLLRIGHRLEKYPDQDLNGSIQSACLSSFLPTVAKETLDKLLVEANILPQNNSKEASTVEDHFVNVRNPETGLLEVRYQDVVAPLKELSATDQVLVPDIVFYDNQQHTQIMSEMLKDYQLGEHILLVGNQGVGKNKVVDRFLQVMNRPREYVQLHRDTTVQSLTLQPSIKDGIIVYEDSPLVLAVTHGRTLVVDEADKAPTHVTGILKSLAESGYMRLSDGREIVPTGLANADPTTTVPIHPDFRLIILANRPGFPFLGHDFYSALGDVFSCYSLDNANVHSELAMLRKYGPDVPEPVLKTLTAMFKDLRTCVVEGQLNYPYSTRELVHIVRHLQQYPNDGLPSTIRNVFDFDSYDTEVKTILGDVLSQHGVPLSATAGVSSVFLTDEILFPPLSVVDVWRKSTGTQEMCRVRSGNLRTQGPWTFGQAVTYKAAKRNYRESQYSELMHDVQLPMSARTSVVACAGSEESALHLITNNPAGLYTFNNEHTQYTHIDLSDLYITSKGVRNGWAMHTLGGAKKSTVVVLASHSDTMAIIDTATRQLRVVRLSEHMKDDIVENVSEDENAVSSIFGARRTKPKTNKGPIEIKACGGDMNRVVLHRQGNSTPTVFDFSTNTVHGLQLPFKAHSVHPLSAHVWLVQQVVDDQTIVHTLHTAEGQTTPTILNRIDRNRTEHLALATQWSGILSTKPNSGEAIGMCVDTGEESSEPKSALSTLMDVGQSTPGPENVDIYQPTLLTSPSAMFQATNDMEQMLYSDFNSEGMNVHGVGQSFRFNPTHSVLLSAHSQLVHVVNAIDKNRHGMNEGEAVDEASVQAYLEIVDLKRLSFKSVPMLKQKKKSDDDSATDMAGSIFNWTEGGNATDADALVGVVANVGGGVISVRTNGVVSAYETRHDALTRGLEQWTYMLGDGSASGNTQLELKYRNSGKDVQGPKVGKTDKDNEPHVGGNTWAGGTGGRDTAGLGGKGGPYRLDAGHEVHQLSKEEKDAVPEHVKKAAREMGQRAWRERLDEINMSTFDAEKYGSIYSNVAGEVTDLRRVLQSLEAKKHERVWLKNESTGDLDDNRLIDGVTGESNIYKRRGEQPPIAGERQQNPKRIRFVMDLSGSMYRFNGFDGRLNRMIDCACMIMESFDNSSDAIRYEIYGHSGEEADVALVTESNTPTNEKERLQVLETMHAHSQFCMSGDNTLQAAKIAINGVLEKEGDEHFVMILSDANLEIYGIHPKELGRVLASHDDVTASAIFLGSLGDQADRLKEGLGRGRGFVCMDTKDLPKIMRSIFQNTVLKSS